jgi:hypothetical protein
MEKSHKFINGELPIAIVDITELAFLNIDPNDSSEHFMFFFTHRHVRLRVVLKISKILHAVIIRINIYDIYMTYYVI